MKTLYEISWVGLYINRVLSSQKMNGAIFFNGNFGSTQQYANWISESTSFPVFDIKKKNPNLELYNPIILGSSLMVKKPTIKNWLRINWPKLKDKRIVLFTVSGNENEESNLKKWITRNLSKEMIERIKIHHLGGRLDVQVLPWWTRLFLKMGSWIEADPNAKKRMTEGFDHIDRASISKVLRWVEIVNYSDSIKN